MPDRAVSRKRQIAPCPPVQRIFRPERDCLHFYIRPIHRLRLPRRLAAASDFVLDRCHVAAIRDQRRPEL